MKIALDVDGVLLDTMGYFCEVYNNLYKDDKTKNDITRFGFSEDWGMSEEEFWEVFDICRHGEIEPIDKKACKYIKKIHKKHDIDIVTARPEKDRPYILSALHRLEIWNDIHYDKLVLTLKDNVNSKAELYYNIYIDDNPNLANHIKRITEDDAYYYEISGEHPSTPQDLLLWQQPWNWRVVSELSVQRVTGWKSIMKWFKNNNL